MKKQDVLSQWLVLSKEERAGQIAAQPLAACADLLYAAREERSQRQKAADKVAEFEGQLKEFFINTLPKSQATGVAGQVARVQINTKIVPTVENWDALYAYVKKNNAFFLLQRRLTESSVKELWEDHKQVPGVGRLQLPVVSCTLLKG